MDSVMSLVIGIGIILVLFSIFGVNFKLAKNPKWKKLDPKKSWGKPGSDIEQWCIRNPKTKICLVYLAQVIVWLWQLLWWLVNNFFKAVWSVFKKISPVKIGQIKK
jgi:hypothetical protein